MATSSPKSLETWPADATTVESTETCFFTTP
jgi:hypothetical protein